ncbi:hypothetical protein NWQ34_04990 [Mycoplasmopsis felis]|uniref:hypothetical protein n=1 Tax=Mycoplasmopsis felis TaxID=33923 RepID=UPI0021E003C6|nr:hypothetical protein [Mycoplasmopsis felis]MCU9938932.1 hypothetical protein [Mycoplasmopsis felis]
MSIFSKSIFTDILAPFDSSNAQASNVLFEVIRENWLVSRYIPFNNNCAIKGFK